MKRSFHPRERGEEVSLFGLPLFYLAIDAKHIVFLILEMVEIGRAYAAFKEASQPLHSYFIQHVHDNM